MQTDPPSPTVYLSFCLLEEHMADGTSLEFLLVWNLKNLILRAEKELFA